MWYANRLRAICEYAMGRANTVCDTWIGSWPPYYLALLMDISYRTTPLPWCGLRPAELLMGRCHSTGVPQFKQQFIPSWPHVTNFKSLDLKFKASQKCSYYDRHCVTVHCILLVSSGSKSIQSLNIWPIRLRVCDQSGGSYITHVSYNVAEGTFQ